MAVSADGSASDRWSATAPTWPMGLSVMKRRLVPTLGLPGALENWSVDGTL